MKKFFKFVSVSSLLVVMAFAMTGCSVDIGGLKLNLNPNYSWGSSSYSNDEYTIQFGNQLQKIGVGEGSSVKVKMDTYGVRFTFDVTSNQDTFSQEKVIQEVSQLYGINIPDGATITSVHKEGTDTDQHFKFDTYVSYSDLQKLLK